MAAARRELPAALGDGAAALHGTLTLPPGDGRCDAVLLWSGSGPADRDGNSAGGLSSNCLKLLAHALADSGFACLRTDRRGIGESRAALGREEDLSFDDFVVDAVDWAAWLGGRTGIRRVFLLGHGEGALAATLAAERAGAAGLVLLSGLGYPAAAVLKRQMTALEADMPASLREETLRIMAALERGETAEEISPALHAAYRPGVQPYLISWFRFDPAAELAKLRLPTLVVHGTADLQATMEDAERLAAARPGVNLVRVIGMNHVLKDAPAGREGNLATYFRPMLPLSAGLVPAIADFLREAGAANDR